MTHFVGKLEGNKLKNRTSNSNQSEMKVIENCK